MDRVVTTAELLAARDGDPLDAEIAKRIRSDPGAQAQIDAMREIQSSLRTLPDGPAASSDAWQKIEARVARRDAGGRGRSRIRMWPLGLVASAGLLAGFFLARAPEPQSELASMRASLFVLQQQSRILESQLMRTSSYAGSPAEQALMFRLADVDAELTLIDDDGKADALARREALWRRRIELMQALQAVQPPAEPTVQYAVY